MLKRKITKTEHTALNALLQAEYKAEGEEFVLSAEGFDDPTELKRALDRVREESKVATQKATAAETALNTLKEGQARANGDIATLEASWKEKMKVAEGEHKIEMAKVNKHLQATLIDSVALKLATDIAGTNADLLLPHIKTRLVTDLTGESPLTRVVDKEGKPSASSVEDLRKEISSDGRFKAIVVASKASGGGAAGGERSAGGGAPSDKKFGELNDKERTEFYKRDPDAFAAASAAHKEEARMPVARAAI